MKWSYIILYFKYFFIEINIIKYYNSKFLLPNKKKLSKYGNFKKNKI